MSWEDDLAAGEGGLEKTEGGLEGNLGRWAEGYTEEKMARRAAEPAAGSREYRGTSYRWTGQGMVDPRLALAIGALVLLLITVLVILL